MANMAMPDAGTELLELQMADSLGERITAKPELDNKDWVWGYYPHQQKRLQELDAALDRLYLEAADHKWTPDQMRQYEMQIMRAKSHILPHKMKRPPTPQEIWDNQAHIVDKRTGRELAYDPEKRKFTEIRPLVPLSEVAKIYKEIQKTEDEDADPQVLIDKTQELINRTLMIQGIVGGVAGKPQPRPPSIEQQTKVRAAVAALPQTFEKIIAKQVKIGRTKGFFGGDKVYGEEAYHKGLAGAIESNRDIPPETVKAEYDSWWDSKYAQEQNDTFQKFAARPADTVEIANTREGLLAEYRRLGGSKTAEGRAFADKNLLGK